MNPITRNQFLLAVALFHLFSDVAFAGGAILCVGPNDHRAVEIRHLAPDCEPAVNLATSAVGIDSQDGECAGCTDSPLHSEAELGTERIEWDPTPPAVLAGSFSAQYPPALFLERTPATRLDLSTTMRAHRSIVLLI